MLLDRGHDAPLLVQWWQTEFEQPDASKSQPRSSDALDRDRGLSTDRRRVEHPHDEARFDALRGTQPDAVRLDDRRPQPLGDGTRARSVVSEGGDDNIARNHLVLAKRLEMRRGDVCLFVPEQSFADVLQPYNARSFADVVRGLEVRSEWSVHERRDVTDCRLSPPGRQGVRLKSDTNRHAAHTHAASASLSSARSGARSSPKTCAALPRPPASTNGV